jgi:membrane fusion protein (multidrug efflux system)
MFIGRLHFFRSFLSGSQAGFTAAIRTGAVAAVGISVLLSACDDGNMGRAAPPAPPPAVTVAPVVATKVTKSIEYVARTYASQAVDVRARVSGFLIERSFKEGGPVAANQQLFQIDPVEFDAVRKAAAAEVERI